MKVQFCINNYFEDCKEVVAEFEVREVPTGAQVTAIYDDIKAIINNGDALDYKSVCEYVAKKHLNIVDSPVVLTFYV